MARFAFNPFRRDLPDWSAPELAFVTAIRDRVQLPLHRALPGYAPTPLRDLAALARELDLGGLLVKDEADRFGLGAFKGLGASFAVYSVLRRLWRDKTGADLPPERFADPTSRTRLGALTFAAATDGNHGRAVAWTARLIGQRAVIFMPEDTAPARIRAVANEGAEVRRVAGTFDDCVAECARTAAREGWQVIADTAYPGNLDLPGRIMTGYSTIFAEIADEIDERPDAVFLPAGVGGIAAAGAASCVLRDGAARPLLVCVEPVESAGFLESIVYGTGEPIAARGNQRSLMVGLCCGMPSLLAWPIVRDSVDLFLAIEDDEVPLAMRAYRRHGVVAGESGAATLAGLIALLRRADLAPARERLGLGLRSRVLVVNTEGATDPARYAQLVDAGPREESP
ncbi:MAG TPA: diaminopropionate ammonia-lyase [Candidatus Krumholzibacteria bacterium]|nr:diaminopropionate ammonia-lyase [Candidatus Krumholzibacteria bacterium]HPD73193.1 diaminopropionate ammonia-lyase [Candidatus Krumholzibacteria bacterium]HRY41929.1 diaminopropionate ammonia-lyase [Candidatus Krumholzibacteria bacterium]